MSAFRSFGHALLMLRFFAFFLTFSLMSGSLDAENLSEIDRKYFRIDERINYANVTFSVQVESDLSSTCWTNPEGLKRAIEKKFHDADIPVVKPTGPQPVPSTPKLAVRLLINGLGYTTWKGECVGAVQAILVLPAHALHNDLPLFIGGFFIQSDRQINLDSFFYETSNIYAQKIIDLHEKNKKQKIKEHIMK